MMNIVAKCPKCDAGLPVNAADPVGVDQVRRLRPRDARSMCRDAIRRDQLRRSLSGVLGHRLLHPQGLQSEGRR